MALHERAYIGKEDISDHISKIFVTILGDTCNDFITCFTTVDCVAFLTEYCTTIHRYPIFSMRYSVLCKVYTGCHGTSEREYGLCACTVNTPLAKARGLSLRTGAQTMLYISHKTQCLIRIYNIGANFRKQTFLLKTNQI